MSKAVPKPLQILHSMKNKTTAPDLINRARDINGSTDACAV